MIKFLASSIVARITAVLVLTFATIVLWSATTHASDTETRTRKTADGRSETCTYQRDWTTARDGSNVYRTAWICVTTSK